MIRCQKCRRKFDPGVEPGGILLSPPVEIEDDYGRIRDPADGRWMSEKHHVCWECWDRLVRWLKLRRPLITIRLGNPRPAKRRSRR